MFLAAAAATLVISIGLAVAFGELIMAKRSIATIDKVLLRHMRLADERWQLLQERHDAVIELIAQIPECPCLANKPGKAEPKPRKKAK